MKKYWVYIHTCPANGKKYVGVTTASKPEFRWKEGRGYWYNKHFYSAILKHGWNSFQHEAWELTSESEMYYAEKYLIAYYHTTESEFGYNHSSGGEKSASGCIRSEETRRKHSEDNLKRWSDPEYRRKMAEAIKKGLSDPEVRRKLSKAHKGKPRSKETKKKVSESRKKKYLDPEFRRKMSEALKGKPRKPFKEETRNKLSEIAKNRPKIKVKLPDGTVLEMTKQNLTRNYINKGKKFEYVS